MNGNRYYVFYRTVTTGVTGLWPKLKIKRAFHRIKLALFNLMLSFITIEKNKRERRKKYGKAVAQIANGFSYILIIMFLIVALPGSFVLITFFAIGNM